MKITRRQIIHTILQPSLKFIISLSISSCYISIIYCIYISLIQNFHLYTIFFQSFLPTFYFCSINFILFSNLVLNNIQYCLIKLWSSYRFLTTKTSFTLSRCRRISCHISIISNIGHTIIIWIFIPYPSSIVNIIKIFSIYSSKFIPKIFIIFLHHSIWRLNTIFTICCI